VGLKNIVHNNFWGLNDYSSQFLRKTKSFNKSRYSRNRQYYRTGVYWCLWLNVIAVVGLYYLFYRFTFRFSYVPYIYLLFILSCINLFFMRSYFFGFLFFLSNLFKGVSASLVFFFFANITIYNVKDLILCLYNMLVLRIRLCPNYFRRLLKKCRHLSAWN
jgi:hypothetical protein